jgi:hypothetical protein
LCGDDQVVQQALLTSILVAKIQLYLQTLADQLPAVTATSRKRALLLLPDEEDTLRGCRVGQEVSVSDSISDRVDKTGDHPRPPQPQSTEAMLTELIADEAERTVCRLEQETVDDGVSSTSQHEGKTGRRLDQPQPQDAEQLCEGNVHEATAHRVKQAVDDSMPAACDQVDAAEYRRHRTKSDPPQRSHEVDVPPLDDDSPDNMDGIDVLEVFDTMLDGVRRILDQMVSFRPILQEAIRMKPGATGLKRKHRVTDRMQKFMDANLNESFNSSSDPATSAQSASDAEVEIVAEHASSRKKARQLQRALGDSDDVWKVVDL